MLNTPFSPWPSFSEEEAEAVQRVLLSNKVNYWTGNECREFEREFAAWSGAKYAIALANGTVALDLALKCLNIGPGDEVVVTPRTFIASVSSVVNAGATPVFADVDIESGNISAETIEPVLSDRTKAIICVHLAGWPCDMDPIMLLARKHGLKVIEDCAQAHGAKYKGRSVGTIGDVGAWSFCQDKIMTTGGEGGMVTTNDEAIWRAMWAYKDHGKSYAAVYETTHPEGFRWLHESFGTNWRMTEMQAAIGRIQLQKMSDWSYIRTRNAKKICGALMPYCGTKGLVRCPILDPDSGSIHAYYKLYAYVVPENLGEGWSRDRLIQAINQKGIPCYQGACSEVYLEKAFIGTGLCPAVRLKNARMLGDTAIMFMVHPTLQTSELDKTAEVISNIFKAASR